MAVKKVVTFRASSIGDALMGKYFLENVHAVFPGAECHMLVGSRSEMIRELLAGYPWLSVIEANRRAPRSLLRAWTKLHGTDLALTQYSEKPFSTPSKIFARLSSKKLIGFTDGWWGNRFFYDALIPFEGEAKSEGMIVEEQKALNVADIPVMMRDLSLAYVPNDSALLRLGLADKPYVVAHLFSGNSGRSISQGKRAEIVKALSNALPNAYIVVTGGKSDRKEAMQFAGEFRNVIVAAGETSMKELISLIASAYAVLSLDTGGAHIAAHLKKPLVVLTRKEARTAWWGGAMYDHRPTVLCNEFANDEAPRETPYPPSMETIDAGKIADIVSKLCSAVDGGA